MRGKEEMGEGKGREWRRERGRNREVRERGFGVRGRRR